MADPAAGCLAGMHALVTGGGSGIGLAVAQAYLAQGAQVTVLERSAARAEALRTAPDHLTASQAPAGHPEPGGAGVGGPGQGDPGQGGAGPGSRIAVETGDTTDPADVARAVARATSPDGRLDILTACAGVFDFYAPVTGLSAAELTSSFTEIFGINVLGTLLAVREAAPALRRANGSVTITLSTAAYHGGGGGVLYAASKSALRGVVRHLAAELAPEVRVNGVAPGGTGATALSGLASLGQRQTADAVDGRDERIRAGTLLQVLPVPEDHAGAYVFLASAAAARVVTGTVITSDGGHA